MARRLEDESEDDFDDGDDDSDDPDVADGVKVLIEHFSDSDRDEEEGDDFPTLDDGDDSCTIDSSSCSDAGARSMMM